MKPIKLNGGEVSLADYAIQGNAMLGIKESGKTYSATYMGEQLFDAGVPFIAFDPIGVWRFLKVAGPGGKGFPVVVAGGEEPDLPLTPVSAPEIVRAAMRERVSLVLDLFDMKLSKADWRRIVAESIRVLLHENKPHGLRHVFIEEAAEFVPQRPQPEHGVVYSEVEKLVRMGGNCSLGVTLINQRTQSVNKEVLELCEGLFLFRQKGSNSIAALEKWLTQTESGLDGEIVKSISMLKAGECWYWPPQSQTPERVTFPRKQSLHPDRRHPPVIKASAKADSGEFIAKLRESVAATIAEQAANDPAALKKELADLKKKLAEAQRPAPAAKPQIVVAGIEELDAIDGAAEEAKIAVAQLAHEAGNARELCVKLLNIVGKARRAAINPKMPTRPTVSITRARPGPLPGVRANAPQTTAAINEAQDGQPLGKCETAILTVLAQHPGSEVGKIALLTGYRFSGGFRNSLSILRTRGLIEGGNGEAIFITEAGLACGPFPALPTEGPELFEHWKQMRHFGEAERKIMDALRGGGAGTGEQLAELTGYNYSGGFRNSLSKLRTAGVIVGKNSGTITLAPGLE